MSLAQLYHYGTTTHARGSTVAFLLLTCTHLIIGSSPIVGSIRTPLFGWSFSFQDHHSDVASTLGSDKAFEVHVRREVVVREATG